MPIDTKRRSLRMFAVLAAVAALPLLAACNDSEEDDDGGDDDDGMGARQATVLIVAD